MNGRPNRRNKAAFFKFIRRRVVDAGGQNPREHKKPSPSNARYS